VYELKGRAPEKPSAEMYFSVEAAEPVLAQLPPRTRAAVERLLPGPLLVVLPGNKGIRIPRLDGTLAPLGAVRSAAVVQTSANLAGGPEPRRLEDVPEALRSGADVVLDGGEVAGVASTVVDLSGYEADGSWTVLREGAVPFPELRIALRS
jgi:L-threonylcarbamoyladenylate synthase